MRAFVPVLLLSTLLSLAACGSSDAPAPATVTSSMPQAVLVGSLALPEQLDWEMDGRRVIYAFRAYDPAANRLIPDGPSFLLLRDACPSASSHPRCDLSQHQAQVVRVPPGHYVLTATHDSSKSGEWQGYYVPIDTTFWTTEERPDAALHETSTVNIEVGPGEVVYFGDLRLSRTQSVQSRRYYGPLQFEVTQDDEAARAALVKAGIDPTAMIFRPAT
jgi:hypothetical protein